MSWTLLAGSALAATVVLHLDVDRIEVGQRTRLHLVITEGRSLGPPQFASPIGLDVRYLHGEQSTQVDPGGGRVLSSLYTYEVQAQEPGIWQIGPLSIPLRDQEPVRTNEVQLRVLEASAQRRGFESFAGFDREEAWEGQLVIYRYELRSLAEPASLDWRLPTFDGLRAPQHGAAEERRTTLAGDPPMYLSRGAVPLVAAGVGDRTQAPALAQVVVGSGRRNALGFRQMRNEVVATEQAPLRVLALPRPPDDFSGLIGEFTMESRIGPGPYAVGDSIPWIIEVSGDGILEALSLPVPAGLTTYEVREERDGGLDGDRFRALATFERALVPDQPGKLEVPEVVLTAFSPGRGDFYAVRAAAVTLDVTGAARDAEIASFEGIERPVPEASSVDVALRGMRRSGPDNTPFLGVVLPVLALLSAAPTLLWAGALSLRRFRCLPQEGEAERAPMLGHEDRLAVLHRQLAEAVVEPTLAEEVGALLAELDRARFAGLPADGLAGRVEALLARIRSEEA